MTHNELVDQLMFQLKENDKMRTTLKEWADEAAEDVEHWGGYASDYFQEKHDYVGDINKWITRKGEV